MAASLVDLMDSLLATFVLRHRYLLKQIDDMFWTQQHCVVAVNCVFSLAFFDLLTSDSLILVVFTAPHNKQQLQESTSINHKP